MPQEPALPRTKSSYPRSINMQDLRLLRAKAHPSSRLTAMLRIPPLEPAALVVSADATKFASLDGDR